MAPNDDTSWIEREGEQFIEPLDRGTRSENAREALLLKTGWNPEQLPLDELPGAFETIFNVHEKAVSLAEDPPESLQEYVEAVMVLKDLVDAIETVRKTVETTSSMSAEEFGQFGTDLLSQLVAQYLRSGHPALYRLAWVLTVFTKPDVGEDPEETFVSTPDGMPLRTGGPSAQLEPERMGDLFTEPVPTLTEVYFGVQTVESVPQAKRGIEKLLPRIAALLGTLGIESQPSTDFTGRALTGQENLSNLDVESSAVTGTPLGSLSIDLGSVSSGVGSGSASADFWLVNTVYFDPSKQGFSLLLEPAGKGSLTFPVGSWLFGVDATVDVPGLAFTPDGIEFEQASDGTLILGATIEKLATESGAAFSIGGTEGTRLEIGTAGMEGSIRFSGEGQSARVIVSGKDSRLVIKPSDAGGFLAEVLPDDGIEATFELGIGYSTTKGMFIQGGGELDVTLPIHQTILEVFTLKTVDISLLAGDRTNAAVAVDLGATATLSLGPVDATIKSVGMTAEFGGDGVNPATVGFKPPDGVGLALEAGVVSGGGFLEFEPEKHRYSGTFDLTIGDYAVTAVGLLKTELEGSDGFSLLVLITGEFPPVQLGFGFTLTGIGGLAGIHRNMKTKPLQNAVRSGNMGSVLFPENVVENAQQIITDLRTIFPPTKDVHVFGPMAKFSWGTPTMITMDVGIVLSIPTWKIAILGKIQMSLPDPQKALVDLKLAVLGILDIPNKRVSIDASLYDSKIALFDVSGDMALRSTWGNDSSFMLSVGGFHPRYSPPKSFPKLDRVKASLSKGGGGASAKIELSAYMSVTPNTFQVGAGLVLQASAGPASVDGELSFDALFKFDPFAFIVDFFAKLMVDIKAFRLGVKIDGTLKGPKPMQIKGELTVEIAFVSTTVHVDVSIGSKPEQTELPSAKIFPDLREELARPQNWDASRPEGNAAPVSLYDPTKTNGDGNGAGGGDRPLLVHPLGTISVRQKIVPLGVSIEKYGNADPRNTRFEVSEFSLAGQSLNGPEPLRENFAPAKYKKMSDSEKLDSEAFEKLPAGRRFTNDRCTYAHGTPPSGGQKLEKTATMEYESSVIDEQRDDDRAGTGDLSPAQRTLAPSTSRELLKTGAVATSDARTTGTDRYRADDGEAGTHSGGSGPISVSEDAYVVVQSTGLDHVEMDAIDDDNPIEGTTQTEARQAKRAYAAASQADADDLRVVGAHEVRSWTVVKAADGSVVNVGSASGVESIFGGVRKAEAHAAMEAYAEETAVDADDLRVVPIHEVGTPQEGT